MTFSDMGSTLSSPARFGSTVITPPTAKQFEFRGSGSEYFRIWIVNLLLTIITFGIYSAWAKVRKAKYLYGSTNLHGYAFEYHGDPMAIFKGRLIALAMIIFYNLALTFSRPIGLLAIAAFMVIMPWLVWKSLQYKLHNSSYRGIRFRFGGELGSAYKLYLGMTLLNTLTLGLLTPLVHQRIKKYQHSKSHFGQTRFNFYASGADFYGRYGLAFLIFVLGELTIAAGLSVISLPQVLIGLLPTGAPIKILVGVFATYIWIFALFPIFLALIQNLIWNNTTLGSAHFVSAMKWPRMVVIMLTNLLCIVCTLGLFTPFAKIRALRYRIESLSVTSNENFEQFMAVPQAELTAAGEGAADLFGFDISL